MLHIFIFFNWQPPWTELIEIAKILLKDTPSFNFYLSIKCTEKLLYILRYLFKSLNVIKEIIKFAARLRLPPRYKHSFVKQSPWVTGYSSLWLLAIAWVTGYNSLWLLAGDSFLKMVITIRSSMASTPSACLYSAATPSVDTAPIMHRLWAVCLKCLNSNIII